MSSGFSIQAIHHVSFIVSDIAKSLRFYVNLLGCNIDLSRPELGYPGAWLRIGFGQLHLLQVPNPDPTQDRPIHGGRDRHLACTVMNLADLEAILTQAGVTYTKSKSGRRALFTRDPDGNALEFIESNQ